MCNLKFILISLIWLAAEQTSAAAGDLFRVFDLKFEGEMLFYHVEDINRDGYKDVIIALKPAANSTSVLSLSLYLQSREGFRATPHQQLHLDETIILFDFGDVIGDAQKELVCLKKQGVFYHSFNDSGFVLTPRKLFDAESAFMLPTYAPTKWELVADLNGDHRDELLLPKLSRLNIYFRAPGGNWLINELPSAMESRVSGMYDPRFSVGNYAEAVYTTPFLLTEDFDADGRRDLLAIYKDSLLVFLQEETGYFAQRPRQTLPLHFGEIWRGAKIQRVRIADESERFRLMRIKDLNGDGVLDAATVRVSTKESMVNPATDVRIYFGRRDSANSKQSVYFSTTPDQIIQPDGTQLVLDIVDINRDGKLDLVIPAIKVGLQNIVKMLISRTVELRADIFLMTEEGRYPKKPDLDIRMVVGFSFRGGATSPVYEIADFNGDGYLDILSSISEKTLAIFLGNDKKGLDTKIGAKFNVLLPQNGEMVRALDLNSDNKCDLVITYNEDNPLHQNLVNVLRVLLAN